MHDVTVVKWNVVSKFLTSHLNTTPSPVKSWLQVPFTRNLSCTQADPFLFQYNCRLSVQTVLDFSRPNSSFTPWKVGLSSGCRCHAWKCFKNVIHNLLSLEVVCHILWILIPTKIWHTKWKRRFFSAENSGSHNIHQFITEPVGGWSGGQTTSHRKKTSMTTYYCPLSTPGLIFDRNIMINSHKYCNEFLLSLKGAGFLNKQLETAAKSVCLLMSHS